MDLNVPPQQRAASFCSYPLQACLSGQLALEHLPLFQAAHITVPFFSAALTLTWPLGLSSLSALLEELLSPRLRGDLLLSRLDLPPSRRRALFTLSYLMVCSS